MYNTVQNHFESHKESRKNSEMITFLRFTMLNVPRSFLLFFVWIFFFFFFLIIRLWHICCTCATRCTWFVYLQGALNFTRESESPWKTKPRGGFSRLRPIIFFFLITSVTIKIITHPNIRVSSSLHYCWFNHKNLKADKIYDVQSVINSCIFVASTLVPKLFSTWNYC